MPRYFFHTQIGDDVVTDESGSVLRDADAAWTVARETIWATMAEPRNQTRLIGACLVVTDEAGDVVFEFLFAEAMVSSPGADGTLH